MKSDNPNLDRIPISNFISVIDERNKENNPYPAIGINKDKEFMPTVANLDGADLRKYKVVRKGYFVFSGMQTGRDMCIRIGLYDNDQASIISPAYTTFVVAAIDKVMPEYFFMYFNREEMDRYGAFCSDGSVRANLDWDRFLDMTIPVPSIEQQMAVVNAWKSLRKIKEENEALAAPLMQLCQSYIQECKHKYPMKELRSFITRKDVRNNDNSVKVVKSVSVLKTFNDTNAKVDKSNLKGYKIVLPNEISFVQTTGNEKCLCAALNSYYYPVVVTSVNEVFSVDCTRLLPEYLHLYYKRTEVDRYARFHSWGSARETFKWEDMQRMKIPVPPMDVQKAVASLYSCALEYKRIAAEADAESRRICPALLQHVINN